MVRTIICAGLMLTSSVAVAAQARNSDIDAALAEAGKVALQEFRDAKRSTASRGVEVAVPADFNDNDSFGKNAQFFGSGYAGTLFVDETCPPPQGLAPDDKCVVKAANANLVSTTYTDPVWQISIPGKSAKNVIYLLMNHTIRTNNSANVGGPAGGQGVFTYSPVVTIESIALNSPLAIDPTTGMPMNGSFTTGLPGTKFRSRVLTAGQPVDENESYASVNGRGLSRVFFSSIGLPDSVIDDIFKKDMKLKFGIRVAQFGSIISGQYSFTVRAIGQ